jgi:hypothetical protein
MRWVSFAVLLITLTITAFVGQGRQSGVLAQSTPAASPEAGQIKGLGAHTLAAGTLDVFQPGTASLDLGRITLDPGTVVPFNPNNQTADLLLVTTGELTFRVAAPMTVARKAERGTPTPPAPEAIAANTEFTLHEGESALFPPATQGEMRNNGSKEATAWVASLGVTSSAAATPTP